MSEGLLAIFESTVFPGATEKVCIPILENSSGVTYNKQSYCVYSPKRINPGDKMHRIADVKKITSGSTPATAEIFDALYREIVPAGTFKASSIRVAEAAKVKENTQRDRNIALINECALIFEKLPIDTGELCKSLKLDGIFFFFVLVLLEGTAFELTPTT